MSTFKRLNEGKLVEGASISPATNPPHVAVFVDGMRALVEPFHQVMAVARVRAIRPDRQSAQLQTLTVRVPTAGNYASKGALEIAREVGLDAIEHASSKQTETVQIMKE